MSYTLNKIVPLSPVEAEEKLRILLAENGFGVLTEIDVQATLKKKLDVEMPSYRILGACNPKFAHQALQVEPHIGTMLPCNVIVRVNEAGETEVAAIDPVASMQAVTNHDLEGIAGEVRQLLAEVIEGV